MKKIFLKIIFVAFVITKSSIILTEEDFDNYGNNNFTSSNATELFYDPFINWNRKVYNLNYKIYSTIFNPIYSNYNSNLNERIRWLIKSSFENYYNEPRSVIFSLLDFDLEGSLISLWRLTLNSVFGIFGLFDVAWNVFELPIINKELEDIFETYNIPDGPYLMLPILGPSTLRNSFEQSFSFALFLFGTGAIIPSFQLPIYLFSSSVSPFFYSQKLLYPIIYSSGYFFENTNNINTNFNDSSQSYFDSYVAIRNNYFNNKIKRKEKNQQAKNNRLRDDNIYNNNLNIFLSEENQEEKFQILYDINNEILNVH